MRSKVVAAVAAGGLLMGAGLITSIISSPAPAQAQEETDSNDDHGPVARIFGLLGEVLDDLVGEGTITQEQADAITEAAENKASEVIEEHRTLRDLLSEFLEDDVITEEEATELPDDHWIFSEAFDEAWEDGELSKEEIHEARPFRRGLDFRRGFRFGALLDDGGIDVEELNEVGDDHPLSQLDLDEYLEDGLITPEELREIFSDLRDSIREDT